MSEFEIFITSKGPVLLEGEQKLKVVDAVLREKSQFGEIVAETKLAKSSASVVLKKLVDDGIIRTEGEGNDKRFYPLAIRIIQSVQPDHLMIANLMREWIAGSIEITPDHVESIIAGFLIIEAHQHGFSFAPILVETARLLAHVAYEKTHDRSGDFVQIAIDFINRTKYINVEAVSKFPPTFNVTVVPNVMDYTRVALAVVTCRFLTEYLSLVTDSALKLSNVDTICDNKICIQLGYKDVIPEFSGGLYHDIKFDDTGSPEFVIYQTNGSYVPVTDELELRILACMEKHPYSSRDLMSELKEPQTTILGHLKKMEESQLLMSQKSGNRSIYTPVAEKILSWERPEGDMGFKAKKYLEMIWEQPEHLVQYLVSFVTVDAKELGFDTSPLLTYLGKKVGEMVIGIVPGITAEELFSVVQSESKRFTGSEIVLKSYNPPTVVRLCDNDMDEEIADSQRVFFNAILSTIFGKLMHVPFVVKSDKISGEGFRKYEASFVPKIN